MPNDDLAHEEGMTVSDIRRTVLNTINGYRIEAHSLPDWVPTYFVYDGDSQEPLWDSWDLVAVVHWCRRQQRGAPCAT